MPPEPAAAAREAPRRGLDAFFPVSYAGAMEKRDKAAGRSEAENIYARSVNQAIDYQVLFQVGSDWFAFKATIPGGALPAVLSYSAINVTACPAP